MRAKPSQAKPTFFKPSPARNGAARRKSGVKRGGVIFICPMLWTKLVECVCLCVCVCMHTREGGEFNGYTHVVYSMLCYNTKGTQNER